MTHSIFGDGVRQLCASRHLNIAMGGDDDLRLCCERAMDGYGDYEWAVGEDDTGRVRADGEGGDGVWIDDGVGGGDFVRSLRLLADGENQAGVDAAREWGGRVRTGRWFTV